MHRVVLTILLLFHACVVLSQQSDTASISASFANINVTQFANEIEKATGYTVYFDKKQFDSIQFNFSVRNKHLSEVLETAFAGTNIRFSIDHLHRIFLLKGTQINTRAGMGAHPTPALVNEADLMKPDSALASKRSTVEAVQTLASVTVVASTNLNTSQLGIQKVDIKTIRQIPMVFGEADVLRAVMSMPGVKTVGEASTGLNVRGGSTDQNLILFNDATIYNPAHFFGLFSSFNPDVVKDVTLYKSSIPARYGGRLSAVLDVVGKEGNKKNITGLAGIGPLTGRFALEGPIVKDKTSFVFGARSTYANWLMNLLPNEFRGSKANFYDGNLHVSHTFSPRSELFVTGYLSHDRFTLNKDTVFSYDNNNISLKWKQVFSDKITGFFTGGWDGYKYQINSTKNEVNAYHLDFSIRQAYVKTHFNYYRNADHTVDFGLHSIHYTIQPGRLSPAGDASLVAYDVVQTDRALENALYLNHQVNISTALSAEAGVRYSMYSYLGPASVRHYASDAPKEEDNLVNTSSHGRGSFIKTYGAPEFRLSIRYLVSDNFSIKGGVNSNRQYIHMLSNTAAMAPTDTWKLSDPNIRPQKGIQYSLGLYRNFKSNTIETSFEVYYKNIRDYLDYKSGANLIMNQSIETDVINTKAKAYGAEFMVKKSTGKLNGWLSYTYSRILLKQDDPRAGEMINNGEFYPANYDKPHDVTFVGNYRISQRLNISLNTNYSTGRPITLPIGRYYYANSYRTLYDKRNGYRIPDYFRADFSINIDGNHKVKQRFHNSWTLGVYNLTGRKNPYSVYYVSEDGVINGYRLAIFGSAIPFLTYNIRF